MAVRLKVGIPFKVDGGAFEDFELLPVGALTALPAVNGTGGCLLRAGIPAPRE